MEPKIIRTIKRVKAHEVKFGEVDINSYRDGMGIGIPGDMRIYVSLDMLDANHPDVMKQCALEGNRVIIADGNVYCPIDWIRKRMPDITNVTNGIEAALKRDAIREFLIKKVCGEQ